jgi:hypothetical protein
MTVEIEMGHLATVNHQRAIKKIVFGLEQRFQNGQLNLEPLPETDIDPGNPESKCPDIILQDNQKSTVPIIIEVSTKRGAKTDYAKMRRLIDDTDYGIEEGFVYIFESGSWLKYSKTNGEVLENTDWSDILGLSLADFIG